MGDTKSGGASTLLLTSCPFAGTVSFSCGASSTCSLPRFTSAPPADITNSLSFLLGSFLAVMRLFCRTDAVASSTETAALDCGELQFPVFKSTAPVLTRTATLVALP